MRSQAAPGCEKNPVLQGWACCSAEEPGWPAPRRAAARRLCRRRRAPRTSPRCGGSCRKPVENA